MRRRNTARRQAPHRQIRIQQPGVDRVQMTSESISPADVSPVRPRIPQSLDSAVTERHHPQAALSATGTATVRTRGAQGVAQGHRHLAARQIRPTRRLFIHHHHAEPPPVGDEPVHSRVALSNPTGENLPILLMSSNTLSSKRYCLTADQVAAHSIRRRSPCPNWRTGQARALTRNRGHHGTSGSGT
jgi:hypothetical protein